MGGVGAVVSGAFALGAVLCLAPVRFLFVSFAMILQSGTERERDGGIHSERAHSLSHRVAGREREASSVREREGRETMHGDPLYES